MLGYLIFLTIVTAIFLITISNDEDDLECYQKCNFKWRKYYEAL